MSGDHLIRDPAALDALYGAPVEASIVKQADRVTPEYRAWIEAAPFAVLATAGPGGLDASPRGDAPGCGTRRGTWTGRASRRRAASWRR